MRKMQLLAVACATVAIGAFADAARAVAVYDSLGPSNASATYGVSVGQVLGDDWEAGIRFTPAQTVRFDALDVALAQTLSGSGAGPAAVTLRLDAGGVPGDVIETLVTPTINTTAGTVVTVPTGFGPTLAAGHQYWVTVDRAPTGILGGMWRYATQNAPSPVTVASRKNGDAWSSTTQPRPYALRISGDAVLPGDANQDGRITTDDYALFDRGQAKHLSGWNNGDFNGDNVVNTQDHVILDAAYVAQNGGTPSPAFLADRAQEFGPAYVAELVALVPEPGAVGIVAAGALVLSGRRRPSR